MSDIGALVLRWDHLIVDGLQAWCAVLRQHVLRGHGSGCVHDGGGGDVQLLSLVLLISVSLHLRSSKWRRIYLLQHH